MDLPTDSNGGCVPRSIGLTAERWILLSARVFSDLSGRHFSRLDVVFKLLVGSFFNNAGGRWWRTAGLRRESAIAMASASAHAPFQRRNWKMVAWFLVSLLPLVVGDRPGFREDPQDAVGLVSAMLSEQPFDTLPQEEEIGGGDSHSPWHVLFAEPSVLVEEERPARGERTARSSETSDTQSKGSRRKKKKKKGKVDGRPGQSVRDCRLERREMRVRDLGMGYESDEIVLFKFCVGSCQGLWGNYDAALRALLANGSLPKRTARRVSAHPCCRPTSYESVSFMDTSTAWRTIESVSAASCECVG